MPPLDSRGLLPPGLHTCANWRAFEAVFAHNEHRAKLLTAMLRFIGDELQFVAAGLELVIGGSFLSSKPLPGDLDCTVLIPVDEIANRGPALQLLIADGAKGRIWTQYGVEAYPSLQSAGANDFSKFFQYVGETAAMLHGCTPADQRGAIKVTSWLPG